MASKHEQSGEHKKAHDLADQALDKAAAGDVDKAKDLLQEAKRIDSKIDQEMAREVEQDRRQAEKFTKGGDAER